MRPTEQLSRPIGGPDATTGGAAESRTGSTAAPIHGAIPAGAMPRPGPRRFIDTMATGDARADVEAGGSQFYDGMERLFTGGDITRVAWLGYCRTYRAERRRLLPQEEALSQVVAAGPPA